jgi:hypothetical protein
MKGIGLIHQGSGAGLCRLRTLEHFDPWQVKPVATKKEFKSLLQTPQLLTTKGR